jgi:hypothetical protein
MTGTPSAVFDALEKTYAIDRGADMVQAWNEKDGVYGKWEMILPYSLPHMCSTLLNVEGVPLSSLNLQNRLKASDSSLFDLLGRKAF